MKQVRSGIGFDSHAFGTEGQLTLGGVVFPDLPALKGHSDGDAIVHAIIDALLGACALGDIGQMFPDDSPETKGMSSLRMLAAALHRIHMSGFTPVNVDVVVVADKPKLSPAKERILASLSSALGLRTASVNVKGKTQEGLTWFTEAGGVAVWATVTVEGNQL